MKDKNAQDLDHDKQLEHQEELEGGVRAENLLWVLMWFMISVFTFAMYSSLEKYCAATFTGFWGRLYASDHSAWHAFIWLTGTALQMLSGFAILACIWKFGAFIISLFSHKKHSTIPSPIKVPPPIP